MMSRIAPRVARTSLVSARGRKLEVHPAQGALVAVERDVGLRDDRLQAVLLELVLAEGAREEPAVSSRRSRSMMNAPARRVSVNFTGPPRSVDARYPWRNFGSHGGPHAVVSGSAEQHLR